MPEPFRLLPSSFDPSDPSLRAVRVARSYEWSSLTRALSVFETNVAVIRIPLFWQVLSLIFDSCSRAGCTLYVNEKDNMPLGEAALRVGGADTVVTDTKDAFAFALFCTEKNTPVKNWFIVHDQHASWDVPVMIDADARIVQEVHASPGYPVLVQCEHLAASRKPHFHSVSVHATEDGAQHDIREFTQSAGACACGKEILLKL